MTQFDSIFGNKALQKSDVFITNRVVSLFRTCTIAAQHLIHVMIFVKPQPRERSMRGGQGEGGGGDPLPSP